MVIAPPDIDGVTEIIAAVGREEILPRFRALAAGDVREKGPGDLVTVADEASEARLAAALTDLLPGSVVVGEEASAADPAVLERLAGTAPVWVVDPLDGTSNFAGGIERFAMIVALVHGGRTVAGWIHEPLDGRTGTAVAGQGAFIDGRSVRVADAAPLAAMTGIVSTQKYAREHWPGVRRLKSALRSAGHMRCAGLEYLNLAEGKVHVAVPAKLKPWDHLAGALMHREAGGHGAMIDGGPYTPSIHDGMLILAPDDASWQAVRDVLTAAPGG